MLRCADTRHSEYCVWVMYLSDDTLCIKDNRHRVACLCLRRSLVSIGSISPTAIQHPTAGGNPAADKGWFISQCLDHMTCQRASTPNDCLLASSVKKVVCEPCLLACKPPNVGIRLWDATTIAGHPLNCQVSMCQWFIKLPHGLLKYLNDHVLFMSRGDRLINSLIDGSYSLFEHTAISFWMFAIHLLHCWYPIKSVKGQP